MTRKVGTVPWHGTMLMCDNNGHGREAWVSQVKVPTDSVTFIPKLLITG